MYAQAGASVDRSGCYGDRGSGIGRIADCLIRTYCVTCHNGRSRPPTSCSTSSIAQGLPIDPAIGRESSEEAPHRRHAARRAAASGPGDAHHLRVAVGTGARPRSGSRVPNPGPAGRRSSIESRRICQRGSRPLALEIDGRALLPPDDTGYGFDNIADVLSLSPSLLDRYLIAAERSVVSPLVTRACGRTWPPIAFPRPPAG